MTVFEESVAGLTAFVAGAVLATASWALAGPAEHAATFCFTWSRTGAPYAGSPVQLWEVDAGGRPLTRLRTGRTTASGCGSFSSPPPDAQVRVLAAVEVDGSPWTGATPGWAAAGSGRTDLGRGLVSPVP